MSTKTNLIEAIKAVWNNDDANETMHQRIPILLQELEQKETTKLTEDVMRKKGFEPIDADAKPVYGNRYYRKWELRTKWYDFTLIHLDRSPAWVIKDKSNRIEVTTIAELEEAYAVLGHDIEITIQ